MLPDFQQGIYNQSTTFTMDNSIHSQSPPLASLQAHIHLTCLYSSRPPAQEMVLPMMAKVPPISVNSQDNTSQISLQTNLI